MADERFWEHFMNTCATRWMIVIGFMLLFSYLTLAGRWTDLGLALVIAGVLWYGIVPEPSSGRQ